MATFSTSFSTPSLPELIFLSPQNPTKRLKLSLYRPYNLELRINFKSLGSRIRAVQREESAVLDEKDRELVTKLNGSVNGNGNYSYSNGSVRNYTNGSAKVESENGSLLEHVNGNGNGNVAARSEEEVVQVVKVEEAIRKKKSIEEIGQEEA